MPDIRIEITDDPVKKALTALAGKVRNLSPVMKIIGEYMLRSTEDRFKRQGPAPGGTPWAPLKPSTLRQKKHNKILTESGRMRGSIRYRLEGSDTVAIGTNVPHAATHQLGGPARIITARLKKALFWPGARHPVKSVKHPGIPARPFLGVSKEDSTNIVGIINRYLATR